MKKKIALLCLLFLVVYSCTKDKSATVTSSSKSTNVFTDARNVDVATLAQLLGKHFNVDIEKVVYNYKDSTFTVDGDMLLPKANAKYLYQNEQKNSKNSSTLHYKWPWLVNLNNHNPITIEPMYGLDSRWVNALYAAVAKWNTTDCPVGFSVRTYPQTADIIVNDQEYTALGSATFPTPNSGNPGPIIRVNYANNTSLTHDEKTAVLMHEMGHTIGFDHTDGLYLSNYGGQTSYFITGTSSSDPNSIMNNGTTYPYFSLGDAVALDKLYPFIPAITSRTLTVSGQASICGTSSSIYTINLPAGADIAWSVSGPLTITSSPTSNSDSITVTATGNGNGNVSATVTGVRTYTVTSAPVHIGPPTLTFTQGPGCDDETVEIRLSHPGSTATSISYTDTDGTLVSGLGDNFDLPPHVSTVDITLTNICGTVTLHKHFVRMLCH